MTHLISGCRERISRQTSTPLPSDNRTSSTATSGSANGISDRASTAVPASPTTSMSPLSSSSSLRPRRTTSWSSRTNTRVIYPPAPPGSACCAHRVKQTLPAGAEPARPQERYGLGHPHARVTVLAPEPRRTTRQPAVDLPNLAIQTRSLRDRESEQSDRRDAFVDHCAGRRTTDRRFYREPHHRPDRRSVFLCGGDHTTELRPR